MTMRYDRVALKATRTDDGFIRDAPILTRTGVFLYRNPDGSTRKEYRPPEAVFAADSLSAYQGIPITDGHPGKVTSKNARGAVLGSVMSPGRQDGDNLRGDVVIYDPAPIEAGKKELSVGYEVRLDEKPGVTPQGEAYDAVQTSIRPNHLALVFRGRAGNARLNLDAADEAASEPKEPTMADKDLATVRLDSGIEYPAAREVVNELERLRESVKTVQAEHDKQQARADAAEKQVKDAEEQQEKLRADAFAQAKARLELEAQATKAGVEFKANAKDREIQEAVIKQVRGDAALDDKSDAYVAAAFDLAIADGAQKRDNVATARKQMHQDTKDVRNDSAESARERYIRRLRGEKVEA